jgi:hypothetical protein
MRKSTHLAPILTRVPQLHLISRTLDISMQTQKGENLSRLRIRTTDTLQLAERTLGIEECEGDGLTTPAFMALNWIPLGSPAAGMGLRSMAESSSLSPRPCLASRVLRLRWGHEISCSVRGKSVGGNPHSEDGVHVD